MLLLEEVGEEEVLERERASVVCWYCTVERMSSTTTKEF